MAKIIHPGLKALLEKFLTHKEWGTAYRQAPAAMKDVMDADLFQFERAKENYPDDEWSPYIQAWSVVFT